MAAAGALYMSGQGCALPTRILIDASVYEQVLEDVLEATSQLALGVSPSSRPPQSGRSSRHRIGDRVLP